MNEQEEFVPIREACKILGLKYRSVKSILKTANVKSFKTPFGQTLYSKKSLLSYISDNTNTQAKSEEITDKSKINIFYCRVSSEKQKDDLERQCELARSTYPQHRIISDIGSGVNWKRKGIKTILEYAMQGTLGEVVIFHKDRLARFGFELFETIINLSGGSIKVLDHDSAKSGEQELAEDLLSIIHVFSCRAMGKRRYKKNDVKDEEDPNLSISNSKENIEEVV